MLDLREGTLFAGDFRVVEPLAHGGMGAVYVTEQVSTGRRRALKVMHPLLVADAKARERFVQEAKVGALVDSDHVVEVIAAGVDEASKSPWLCMELLEGETLQARIQRLGMLPAAELREVAVQLRHALARAHAKGLVHRDLKPDNIFLERPRRAGVPFTLKVLDFGIAKLVQQAQGRTAGGTQSVGSPLWMAPEQANAQPVSPATDVWAVGLIAFMAATGRLYWRTAAVEGDLHMTRLLVEILMDPLAAPSVRAMELQAAVVPSGEFDAWFARCVARAPEERFAEGGACLDGLVHALDVGASVANAPARQVGSFASAPTLPSTPAPPLYAPQSQTIDPPSRPAAKRGGIGLGQVAALLGGSALIALLAVFGGVIGLSLSSSEDDEPAVASGADIVVETRDQAPAQPPAPRVPEPVAPVPVATRQLVADAGPEAQSGAASRRPVATSAAGRAFHGAAVAACWSDELTRGRQPATRIRFEITSAGTGMSNVKLPSRWQRTPFARCVVSRISRVRFAQPPRSNVIVLNLPAGG